MQLLVQKYGGTSVGSPERICMVARRIAQAKTRAKDLVVVVSAMGDATDKLILLAQKVSTHPSIREMDMLLTAGERISMSLLSMALADLGIRAVSFTGSQSGIITDKNHGRARIQKILGDRIHGALAEGWVTIVAGFQGVSVAKEITTLGRGGSDTTAVALAAALKADLCEIYTDVDGVYSADPRIVPHAKLWQWIPLDLMIEMGVRGAGVLHPRSVELAKEFQVTLKVRNTLNESEGTEVRPHSELDQMEEFKVTGITCDRSKALLTLELSRPTVLGAVLERAAQAHLMMVSPVFEGERFHVFIETSDQKEWKKNLEELSVQGFVKDYRIDSSLIPLSIVGSRFTQDGAALNQMINVLAHCHIHVTLGAASALAVTMAVPATRVEEGLQALHAEFFKTHSQSEALEGKK